MKKVLSLLLAVVLVCSMATVAFGLNYSWTCDVCGGETGSATEYDAHILEGKCGTCAYCGKGFSKVTYKDEKGIERNDFADHQYICPNANIFCDYCGETKASEAKYAEHIAACKAEHFYLPIGLIINHVKDFFGKLDFKRILNDGKSFFGYVGTIFTDVKDNVAA